MPVKESNMRRKRNPESGNAVLEFAICTLFLIPMTLGIFQVGMDLKTCVQAAQISRDIGSMFAQGVDFTSSTNQNIVVRLTQGLGMTLTGGNGVVNLSKIYMVQPADCTGAGLSLGQCNNVNLAVVTQRFVIGNSALQTSVFGSPASIDSSTGNVNNWLTDTSARATNFNITLNGGEWTYASETYFTSVTRPSGIYAKALF
jgi:hypothetical protein